MEKPPRDDTFLLWDESDREDKSDESVGVMDGYFRN